MTAIKVILILIDVLACLLLIGLILIQRSKSEGMGGLAMGAGMGEALFGSRAGNVLTRGTIVLACIFMGSTTLLAVLYSRTGTGASEIQKAIQNVPTAPAPQQAPMGAPPAMPAPAAPAPLPVAPAAPVEATPASPVAAPVAAPVAPAPAPAPANP